MFPQFPVLHFHVLMEFSSWFRRRERLIASLACAHYSSHTFSQREAALVKSASFSRLPLWNRRKRKQCEETGFWRQHQYQSSGEMQSLWLGSDDVCLVCMHRRLWSYGGQWAPWRRTVRWQKAHNKQARWVVVTQQAVNLCNETGHRNTIHRSRTADKT